MTIIHDLAESARLILATRSAKREWGDRVDDSSDYVDGWNDSVGEFAEPLADQLEAACAMIGKQTSMLHAAARTQGTTIDNYSVSADNEALRRKLEVAKHSLAAEESARLVACDKLVEAQKRISVLENSIDEYLKLSRVNKS